MLGAIVGDLAAWTHENNKECFYSSLTSSDAKFSPLGEVAFATAMWAIIYRDGAQLRYGSESDKFFIRNKARHIQLATLHWVFDHPNSLLLSDTPPFYNDKEGIYAANIIAEIIPGLRNGKTKAQQYLNKNAVLYSRLHIQVGNTDMDSIWTTDGFMYTVADFLK